MAAMYAAQEEVISSFRATRDFDLAARLEKCIMGHASNGIVAVAGHTPADPLLAPGVVVR